MKESAYNCFVYDSSEENSNEVKLNGYIYYKDGHLLERRGDSTSVYLAKVYSVNKKNDSNRYDYPLGLIDLKINHDDFTFISFVIMKEGGNELEYKCFAFESHNYARRLKKNWKNLLNSSYSSVPNKRNLKDNEEDDKANLARKAVISVLKGDKDITDGAEFWDGTDFLMLGDSEKKFDCNKIGSNKFDEYKFVEIRHDLYDRYLEAQGSKTITFRRFQEHTTENEAGQTHTHVSRKNEKGKTIEKIIYKLPAKEFSDPRYRTCTGDFYYDKNPTGKKNPFGISATIVAGKSIFWKRTKVRLTSGNVGDCTNTNCKIHSKKH